MLKARLIHEFSVPLFYRLQSHVNIYQNCINSALKGLFTSFLHPFQPSVAFRTERRLVSTWNTKPGWNEWKSWCYCCILQLFPLSKLLPSKDWLLNNSFQTIDQTKTCLMSKLLQGAMKLQEQYIITIDAFSGFSTNNFLTTKQFTIKLQ